MIKLICLNFVIIAYDMVRACSFEYDDKGRPKSNCMDMYRYTASARNFKAYKPSTNVPIEYPIDTCNDLTPKYLLSLHIQQIHSNVDSNNFKHLFVQQKELETIMKFNFNKVCKTMKEWKSMQNFNKKQYIFLFNKNDSLTYDPKINNNDINSENNSNNSNSDDIHTDNNENDGSNNGHSNRKYGLF